MESAAQSVALVRKADALEARAGEAKLREVIGQLFPTHQTRCRNTVQ